MADGSTSSMPDTPRNQKAFPQSKSQGIGLGFPLVRYVAIIALATGVVRDLATGPYKGKETGETALLRKLLKNLSAGEILLRNRYFASFFMIADHPTMSTACFGCTGAASSTFAVVNVWALKIVTSNKRKRPEWMDEETYAQIPDEMRIRELRITVDQPGFRVNELVLVTTMLDATEYPELWRPFSWNVGT